MCKFFSLISDGEGNIYYFDSEIRKEILNNKLHYETTDSHTSIADFFGFKGEQEDKMNKWEYNVFTQKLTLDRQGAKELDETQVLEQCKSLDFKTIVPELVIKPILNPLIDKQCLKVTDKDIELLKQWASVWASVCASVGDSAGASVWASVWASVGAYISSFLDIKYQYDYSPCIQLWEKGLVSSFDGKKWQLYGYKGKILWEGKI